MVSGNTDGHVRHSRHRIKAVPSRRLAWRLAAAARLRPADGDVQGRGAFDIEPLAMQPALRAGG
jgi:hypothetical protein